MEDHKHILLVEANRYQALLIGRELIEDFPECVIQKAKTVKLALKMVGQLSFDTIIVNCDHITPHDNNCLRMIRQLMPQVAIIALGKGGVTELSASQALNWANEYVSSDDRLAYKLPVAVKRHEKGLDPDPEYREERQALHDPVCSMIIRLTASTLAHEINNPLMAILGTTELLLEKGSVIAQSEVEKVRMIRESARRIESALGNLTDKVELSIEATPVGPLINSDI